MTKKQEFIEYVEALQAVAGESVEMSENVQTYWEAFKGKQESEKPAFTDNGKLVLKYMQDNPEVSVFKAKDIGDGLFVSSRTVSGAIRKLVTDGYVEKLSQDPVTYAITEKGMSTEII